MNPPSAERPFLRVARAAAVLLGIAVIGYIDYSTGEDVRVYALYYIPISFAAWRFGQWGSGVAAVLSTLAWIFSNAEAGVRFDTPVLWAVNTTMQAVSFGLVGWLIAAVREREAHEAERAATDALTQQLNRRAFEDRGARLVDRCRRTGKPVTIAFVDLDDFKLVNDRAGHAEGDRVLAEVAAVIQAAVRPTDLTARYGGDEFVLVLPELGLADATAVLERVRTSLETAMRAAPSPVTATIGAAVFSTPAATLSAMVQAADGAMYAAKRAGKNRVIVQVAHAPVD